MCRIQWKYYGIYNDEQFLFRREHFEAEWGWMTSVSETSKEDPHDTRQRGDPAQAVPRPGRKPMTNSTSLQIKDHMIGKGVKFERIRRITGYLVGTLDRFNNAKLAEVQERVSHATCKKEDK